ncbi:MAG: DUF6503 family protein [Nonlabens sp.]|uniref:DUF6503 family protein n=1 Tax=Nonlabens sp. TaxID=1888209 RepID=UPI00321B2F88
MKIILSTLLFLLCITGVAQELTGQELLDKAIQVHDPFGNWESFNERINVRMTTPDKSIRNSFIHINLPYQFFQVESIRDSISTVYVVDKDQAVMIETNLTTNVKKRFEEGEKADLALMMKNYYTYLYGLPMKLKDQGTNIDSKVDRKTFKGKEYLVLKATYDQNVGSDVWFFYFDPATFKMEIYQFFKTDESGKINLNSGEYILLSDNHVVNDINMPKTRKWYYNKDDQYLGTDVITK